MTDRRNTVVCFSGHRYYAAEPGDEARLAAAVEAAWADGYRTFISGMAPGFDLAAAEAVLRLKDLHGDVRLVAAVPFAGQPRGYSPADLAQYEALLAAADEVVVLSEYYSRGCYYRRDEWMVDRSARIICWYDGGNVSLTKRRLSPQAAEVSCEGNNGRSGLKRAPKAGSGTRYTVRHAVKSGLEVVNLFRDTNSLFL